MEYNFCTLFDSYYLTRGLALYYSLEATCEKFHLYIFAFDDKCHSFLQSLHLKNATIISLKEFEDDDLILIKPTRTIAEYCWTCASSTILYSIKRFKLQHCTYLDADIMFFSSPAPIFEEIGDNSVGITPHNFAPKFTSLEIYGKYCVQFVYFKNDEDGLKALNWWRKSCIEWCYAKLEDGKYGDQKYLDYFRDKFNNVYEITHNGAGVAPWNIANFNLELDDNNINIILRKNSFNKFQLIFYHYQGLKFKSNRRNVIVEASKVKIPKIVLDKIYLPYITRLIKIINRISGSNNLPKNIVFSRKLITIIVFNVKQSLRRFAIIMKMYYFIKKKRYNRPIGIDFRNDS
jgi:hypothetical protein